MANVETNVISQETMSSLVMDTHKPYGLPPENCAASNYPEVKFRTSTTNETQRKKRAKNRLSNRRSTGFVFEEDVDKAMKMGAEGGERTNQ